jgi:vacuolar protein sorting-associated protein IST1
MFGGYQASKLKPQLKMAITRLSIAANKKTSLSKQQTREIAKLLAELPHPKEEKARIKAEAVIRDDDTIEAYEILSLNCDLLYERINLISYSKHCPADLVECISTLIWASTVVDIPELIEVRKQFRYKYGKEFTENAIRNAGGMVNERVASKLSVQPPSAYDVQVYLERIADEHGVSWKPKVPLKASDMYNPTKAPTGHSVPVRGGSGVNDNYNNTNTNNNNYNYNISPSCPPMSPMTMSSPSTICPSFNGPPNPFTVYLTKPMGIVFEEDDDVGHQGGTNNSSCAGIFVAEILQGTPAESIEILQVGDQLISVGGVHVTSLEEALLAIQSCMNEKVKLMFYRSLCNSDDNEQQQQQYDHVSSELTTPETMTPYSSTRSVIVDDQEKDDTTIVYSDATIAKSKQSSKGGDNNNNNNNKASSTGEIPSKDGDSFDDLAARFARLRR